MDKSCGTNPLVLKRYFVTGEKEHVRWVDPACAINCWVKGLTWPLQPSYKRVERHTLSCKLTNGQCKNALSRETILNQQREVSHGQNIVDVVIIVRLLICKTTGGKRVNTTGNDVGCVKAEATKCLLK